MDMVNRFEVYWVNLDPTIGSEMKKCRPAVIVSSNEMNHHLNTVIIAPLTSTLKNYPTRLEIDFEDKSGQIVFDQLRTIDVVRLQRRAGMLDKKYQQPICDRLVEMFVY